MDRYLVVGAGVSGIAACKLLNEKGFDFILYDGNAGLNVKELKRKNTFLADRQVVCGKFPEELCEETDICVLSPGVPVELPFVELLRDKGVVISGEIELAYSMGKGRVCAITGTNGKTTTTALVGEIVSMAFSDTRVVGNIGIPYTSVAGTTTDESVIVAEISSFQLETISTFKPHISAILNITPDHLDRHHTMESYIAAKERITENQDVSDYCVLNYDDEVLREFGKTLKCDVIWFSSSVKLEDGVYYDNGALWQAKNGESDKLIDTKELNILGVHNYENACAAVAICSPLGISPDIIRKGLREFKAVAHRIEFICEKKGVKFYDDSKGTNPDAAIKAVLAMEGPTLLIGGGYDKDASYDEWVDAFFGRVKKLILIGATADKIEECARNKGFTDIIRADGLKEAVDAAYELAEEGDSVLLSPACASWDMFKNYEERGRLFAKYSREL